MADSASLLAFLSRVRRRYITTQLLRQSVMAMTAGLAGLILLLLFGTQVMEWYWPALLFTAAFGWGAWRFLRELPSPYKLAQMVDHRLGLSDALSTAFHFAGAGGPIIEAQRGRAAAVAGTLSPALAVPMVWPRAIYAMAALALAAATLLAVRYGVLHTLDLRAPVSEAVVEMFRPSDGRKMAAAKAQKPWVDEQLQKLGLTPDESAKDELRKFDGVQQGEITTPQIPDVNDLSDEASGQPAKGGQENPNANATNPQEGEGAQKGKDGGKGDSPDDASQDGGAKSSTTPPSEKAQSKPGGGPKSGSNENSSLMDKMRDAFANMMNKMKSPPNQQQGQGQQQQASNQKGGEKGQSGQKGGEKSQQKQNGQEGDSESNGEEAGDQQGDQSQQANAKGQGSDSNSNQKAPPDAKAGVGKADGDKAIKDAEQQQAMGKISELFGKRAQNIQGEVMVEVSGGKQQLRTQYSRSGAAHGESGGEIHRDEVPLHHQQYVQQYFEEVRRQAGTGAAAPAPVQKK